jgi:hypothetical protein
MFMLCHKPEDEKAEPGVVCHCQACGVELVCTHANAHRLDEFKPICLDCGKKGPEWCLEQIARRN